MTGIIGSSRASAVHEPSWVMGLLFLSPFPAGLVAALLPPDPASIPAMLGVGAALALCTALFALGLRRPERTWLDPLPAYLLFGVVALLRDLSGGGTSGLSALVALPILWLAMTGTRRELVIAGVLAAAVFIVPLVAIGPPDYPGTDWRRALIWSMFALLVGPVVQRMMMLLRSRETVITRERNRADQLFTDAPHGIAVLDTDGVVVRANDSLLTLLGGDRDRIVGSPLTAYAAGDDPAVDDHLRAVLAERDAVHHVDCTVHDLRSRDLPVALHSRVLPNPGDHPDSVLVHVTDLSERRRYEQRLSHLAGHDALTGLANRRLFDEALARHLETSLRLGPSGAVLLLDLDNFKEVNDTLGHRVGDELLMSTAALLRNSVRRSDVVSRLGGDEFAVLLPDADQSGAEKVADLIVRRIDEHANTLHGTQRRVSASVGVVTMRAAAGHDTDILALADMTMYDAKDAGKGRYAVLDEGSTGLPGLGARLQWQARIQQAVERDGFVLLLQPILDLSTGRIESAEVLLRMPVGDELVPPSRFLYIAERTGLMPEVDAWVVRHSVPLIAALRRHRPDFRLEVNLSPMSLGDTAIEDAIRATLAEHGVDAAALILEITETAAFSDVERAREFAERIGALGCEFALDDFGAGFGSFYYLKHLTFDYVKIDGEFVANSHRSATDRTILRSIAGVARDLGKRTVAEYVSEEAVLEVVRAEGVDYAQGFLIGEPVGFDEFVARHLAAPPP